MVRKAHGQEGEFPRLHLLFITDVPSRRPRRMVWGLTLRVDVVSGFRGTLNRGFFYRVKGFGRSTGIRPRLPGYL